MVACSIKTCKNRSENVKEKKIKFFSFPKNHEFASKWMQTCDKEVNLKTARICSVHFLPTCYKEKPKHYGNYSPRTIRSLLPDAVPTENLFNNRQILNEINKYAAIHVNINKNSRLLVPVTEYSSSTKFGGVEATIHNENNTSTSNYVQEILSKNVENEIPLPNITENVIAETIEKLNENVTENEKYESKILKLTEQLARERKQNKFLKIYIKRLQKENKTTVKIKIYEILQKVFTPQQIHKLINPQKKRVKWGIEDIASAMALRSVSPKAYRYLKKNNYPLPGLSTLRNWVSRLDLAEGVLLEILALMKRKAGSLLHFEKIVVVCFDEIYISQKVEIDRKVEQVVGPHKTCQIGIARGLFSKWKQTIYYSYDQALNLSIVNEIIKKLYDARYTVVAITTDLASSNNKTWKDLNVGIHEEQKCYFTHPSDDNLKVFVFADGPHLLKLIRNHYLDKGFKINDKHISKTCIETMLSINYKDLKVMFKVKESDLNVTGQARQKVSTAAKLFSQTTARAIG